MQHKGGLISLPGPTKKGVNRNFSWPHLDKHYVVEKLSISEVSAGRVKRLKNYSSLKFLDEDLEKFRSTELYHAPLEGPTIFLSPSSTSHTPLDSSPLGELIYAFSAVQDVRLKITALEPLSIDDLKLWAAGRINIFILIQLHKPYMVGKLLIR